MCFGSTATDIINNGDVLRSLRKLSPSDFSDKSLCLFEGFGTPGAYFGAEYDALVHQNSQRYPIKSNPEIYTVTLMQDSAFGIGGQRRATQEHALRKARDNTAQLDLPLTSQKLARRSRIDFETERGQLSRRVI